MQTHSGKHNNMPTPVKREFDYYGYTIETLATGGVRVLPLFAHEKEETFASFAEALTYADNGIEHWVNHYQRRVPQEAHAAA